jgi:hypothetical protein
MSIAGTHGCVHVYVCVSVVAAHGTLGDCELGCSYLLVMFFPTCVVIVHELIRLQSKWVARFNALPFQPTSRNDWTFRVHCLVPEAI